MAEKHDIEIEIMSDGETKVHIKGIKGKRCVEYTEIFKKIIGEMRELNHTSEYYEPDGHIKIDGKR